MADNDNEPRSEEIYYLLAYDIQTGKWTAADEVLSILTENQGEVYVTTAEGGTWRPLEDGIEKDMDFDNTELLTKFLRENNQ